MALYADALKKYQTYLDGGQMKQSTSRLNPNPQPAPEPDLGDPTRQPPPPAPGPEAPSVPTSTNAELGDKWNSYDQMPMAGTGTAIGADPATGWDPYADLAGAHGATGDQMAKWEDASAAMDAGGGPGVLGDERRIDELPPPEPSVDDLVEQALRDLLDGPRDTSEDEAMLREEREASMLQGLADNQARMAAMGFGASGAMAGMDADIRGQANRDVMDEILGVRADARDDWLREVGTGLGADLTRREFASREGMRDSYAELLDELAEGEGEDEPVETGYADPQEFKDQGFTEVVNSRVGGNSSSPYVVHTVRNPDTGEEATVTVPYVEENGWGEY